MTEAASYIERWKMTQKGLLKEGADCAYLYAHVEGDTDEPFYIGMGETFDRPWQRNRTNKHKNRANKHGMRVHVEATPNLTWENALWWEVRWIKAFRDAGYDLVNLTDGGDGVRGYEWSNQLKERHKIRLNSPETKEKRKLTNALPKVKEIRKNNTAVSWTNESVRKSRCAGIQKVLNSLEYKKKRAEIESRPELKEIRKKAAKEAQNRPEVKEIKIKRALEQWACPEKKRNHKIAMENPEVGKKISLKKIGILRTDAQKANIRAGQKAFQNSRTANEKALSSAKANETKRKNGTLRPNRTTEENIKASKKGWETRRRNQLLKKGVE